MTRKRDPLDIEWWESPVNPGTIDWQVIGFPLAVVVAVLVVVAIEIWKAVSA